MGLLEMDAKTKGAWLVHHTLKLGQLNGPQQFPKISSAGKAGILLSALSASDQMSISRERAEVLASAAGIHPVLELPVLLRLLQEQNLIEASDNGVEVLGVTTPVVMEHTAAVFDNLHPSDSEIAALALSEITSQSPLRDAESRQFLTDQCRLAAKKIPGLLEQAEDVGFVDFEDLGGEKVYFNGNLFRREHIAKTQKVLDSLTPQDSRLIHELEALLKRSGCAALPEVTRLLGPELFNKLNSIGMYDVNVVNNDQENTAFVTLPAAFSKYGNPLVEDALDLAKAFVSSLTYGMTRSDHARGRIRMIEKLMSKLIRGEEVGPVEAIGKDYRALELKNVVEVRPNAKSGHYMKLLKRDIGAIALEVIKAGDASDMLLKLPGATVTDYIGPEANREKGRKRQSANSKSSTRDIVMALRTGTRPR